jgi:hypothetical protein
MKNQIRVIFVAATAAVTLSITPASALAGSVGYRAVGDDGIAASPKVRQMLNERHASVGTATAAAPAMACPKCADVQTTKVSPQAKGAEIMTGAKQVSFMHTCAGCETKLTVADEGKAKHQVATHKCAAETPSNSNCCASR